MEAIMEQMKLKNIDMSNWKKYRFDAIAKNISERVDPNKTDLTTYIGLEHIDSENIHITRFGTPADVNGTKLRFYKGDIIFGRRRAYQRKAGIAECDGFCSAHALVLRANPEVIHPKLFPFFLHSDSFMDRAVNISVGSLSPTINWGTLKFEEFLLPPPEEQEKLAELLWAMDEVIEREKTLLLSAENLKYTYFNNVITYGISFDEEPLKYKSIKFPSSWKAQILKDLIISIKNGISEAQNLNHEGLRVTRIETISNGMIDVNKVGYVKSTKEYLNYKLNVGDILFSHINSISHIGKVALYDKDYNLFHGVNLMRLVPNPSIINYKFLFYQLKNNQAKKYFEARAKQAINQASLHQDDICSLPLAVPNIDLQEKIVNSMEKLDAICGKTTLKIQSSIVLQESLINQLF